MFEDIRKHAYHIFCHRNPYCAGRNYVFGGESIERTVLHFLETYNSYDKFRYFVRNTFCRLEYNRIGWIFTCFAQFSCWSDFRPYFWLKIMSGNGDNVGIHFYGTKWLFSRSDLLLGGGPAGLGELPSPTGIRHYPFKSYFWISFPKLAECFFWLSYFAIFSEGKFRVRILPDGVGPKYSQVFIVMV